MKFTTIFLGLVGMMFMVTACSHYDEGPSLSLYSKGKRVQGTWYFSRVLYNEVDSSQHYMDDRIEFSLEGNGKDRGLFTWLMNPMSSSVDAIKLGSWEFVSDKDSVALVFLPMNQGVFDDTIHWKIRRLAYDEWWMERQLNDTTILTWELWKWVF